MRYSLRVFSSDLFYLYLKIGSYSHGHGTGRMVCVTRFVASTAAFKLLFSARQTMYQRSSQGPRQPSPQRSKAVGVHLLQQFNEHCALWRYRCPAAEVGELGSPQVNSLYSPEFTVGGRTWRIHLQERAHNDSGTKFLAIHLQCVSPTPSGTYAHFKLTLCNANRENARAKAFHCAFKRGGSAWGLHHFVEKERLLSPDGGFIDYGTEEMPSEFDQGQRSSRSAIHDGAPAPTPCIVIDCLLRVVLPNAEGNYDLGLPSVPKGIGSNAVSSQPQSGPSFPGVSPPRSSVASNQHFPQLQVPQVPQDIVDVALLPPGDGVTCDMKFKLSDDSLVPVHRCVVAARLKKLVPPDGLKQDQVLPVHANPVVFEPFIKYVYTEEPPERGTLKAAEFIDLYLLAMKFEFYVLAECCLAHVEATIRYTAILPIACAKYDPQDELLTNFYIRIMATGYKEIIEDPQYESLPGALHRRLSLVVFSSTSIPPIVFPKMTASLSAQLANLAESGEYTDYEIPVAGGHGPLKAHKVVLASRSPVYNQVLYKGMTAIVPDLTGDDFAFSRRAWDNWLQSLYRGGLNQRDLSAEDITAVYKLSDVLQLRGSLREGARNFINDTNALRVLIYAEKHNVTKLRAEPMMVHVCATFSERIARDQAAWDLVADLPKQSLLGLFRGVVGTGKR